jgi:hypothetical protein
MAITANTDVQSIDRAILRERLLAAHQRIEPATNH